LGRQRAEAGRFTNIEQITKEKCAKLFELDAGFPEQGAPEFHQEFLSTLVPLAYLWAKRLRNGGAHRWQTLDQLGAPGSGVPPLNRIHHFLKGIARVPGNLIKWLIFHEQLVQNQTEAKQIRLLVDPLAPGLFRGHVEQGPLDPVRIVRTELCIVHPGKTPIEDLDLTLGGKHDIGRF
jgi:hypothetical protein